MILIASVDAVPSRLSPVANRGMITTAYEYQLMRKFNKPKLLQYSDRLMIVTLISPSIYLMRGHYQTNT